MEMVTFRMEKYLFTNTIDFQRLLIVAVCAYFALIVLLRLAGKRTLAKMNAFDFVVTIAIGSTLSTVILNKNVPLVEGILAFVLLIGLQIAISWLSMKSPRINHLVKATPALPVYDGVMLRGNMRKERITEKEILAALRNEGLGSISDVKAVVIETTGGLSILPLEGTESEETLRNVKRESD